MRARSVASSSAPGSTTSGLPRAIGPADAPRVLNKEVSVAVGPVRERADGIVVPLRLEATGRQSLFPILDADLDLAPLGSSMTQVTL